MQDLVQKLEQLGANIAAAVSKLGLDKKRQELGELESKMGAADFWQDRAQAARVSSQAAQLKKQVKNWESLQNQANDLMELAKTGDAKLHKDLAQQYQKLKSDFEQAEFELKLSGAYDQSSAILAIHAGTGGTDAMDWAKMLERMYLRWGQNHDYKTEVVSETAGEEAGLKSAQLFIHGPLAYGKLKGEHGVHRLVRKSPFNADHLRQTSFALVEVLPQLDEPEAIELDAKDLRVDVFRASGHGGQSVNKTESAVRVTHLPTGITVSIQNERSQLQNRETALSILRARLAKLADEQRQAEIAKLKGPSAKAEWGRQIRNYVLDPYKLVKDVRTGQETSNVEAVLNGQIEGFIDAYLQKQIGESSK